MLGASHPFVLAHDVMVDFRGFVAGVRHQGCCTLQGFDRWLEGVGILVVLMQVQHVCRCLVEGHVVGSFVKAVVNQKQCVSTVSDT